jgi:hypothetical protein
MSRYFIFDHISACVTKESASMNAGALEGLIDLGSPAGGIGPHLRVAEIDLPWVPRTFGGVLLDPRDDCSVRVVDVLEPT